MRKLSVRVVRDESGLFRAWCPHLPGCACRAGSREEAIASLIEAIRGYLAAVHDAPSDRAIRVVHHATAAACTAGEAAIPMCG